VALPDAMDALEAAMLEPLGVAIRAVDLVKPRLLEPVALLGAAFRCDCQPLRTDNVRTPV
jgi:hypothetical protein